MQRDKRSYKRGQEDIRKKIIFLMRDIWLKGTRTSLMDYEKEIMAIPIEGEK